MAAVLPVWVTVLCIACITVAAGAPWACGAEPDPGLRSDGARGVQADPATAATPWSRPIGELQASIAVPPGEMRPPDDSATAFSAVEADQAALQRRGPPCLLVWAPPRFCHRPLYFEEVQLERYGRSCVPRLHPLVSGAHFVSSFALLPVKMVVDPPLSCTCLR